MAICSSRKHRRRRCRGWAGWAHSGRLAAQGARHGTVSMCCRPFLLFAVTPSPNAVDPAVLEQVEAAAGSSHKGRFHARLCAEGQKAGCRRLSLCLPFPGSPERGHRPSRITSPERCLLMHGIWHGMAWPECGQPPATNQFHAIAAVSAFWPCPSSGDRDSLGSLSEQRESR